VNLSGKARRLGQEFGFSDVRRLIAVRAARAPAGLERGGDRKRRELLDKVDQGAPVPTKSAKLSEWLPYWLDNVIKLRRKLRPRLRSATEPQTRPRRKGQRGDPSWLSVRSAG
jgi:hypothetical protein